MRLLPRHTSALLRHGLASRFRIILLLPLLLLFVSFASSPISPFPLSARHPPPSASSSRSSASATSRGDPFVLPDLNHPPPAEISAETDFPTESLAAPVALDSARQPKISYHPISAPLSLAFRNAVVRQLFAINPERQLGSYSFTSPASLSPRLVWLESPSSDHLTALFTYHKSHLGRFRPTTLLSDLSLYPVTANGHTIRMFTRKATSQSLGPIGTALEGQKPAGLGAIKSIAVFYSVPQELRLRAKNPEATLRVHAVAGLIPL